MDLEKRFAEARRRAPSEALDLRVERLFADAAMQPPPIWARPIRLWQCAAACLLCLLAGAVAARMLYPPPPQQITHTQTVYIVPMEPGALARLSEPRRAEPPAYQLHVVPKDGKAQPL